MHVEDEVVRDLRHSVGNHFHKLYYWADRIGSDGEKEYATLAEELSAALGRFQEFLELGLRYFEADRASIMEMAVSEVAGASASVLRTELPATAVEIDVDSGVADARIALDPQRFSVALRLIASLLGGVERGSFSCRFGTDGENALVTIEAFDGEAPRETPVIEWAIARKAIAMQGGVLRASSSQDDGIGGCVVRLPLGK